MPNEIDNSTYRKIYDAELRIISPVVIQTGETYGFMEILPSWKTCTGKLLDIGKTLSNLDERTLMSFVDYVDSQKYNEARELFLKREGVIKGSSIIFTQKSYDKIKENSNIEISKPIVNPMTNKPYIPGSSIKGALRTAFLEYKRDKELLPQEKEKTKDFEYKILGNNGGILDDPFKNLLVSDFFIQNSNLVIGDITVGSQIPTFSGMTDAWCFRKKKLTFNSKDKGQMDVIAKGTIVVKYPKGKTKTPMKKVLNSLSFYDRKFLDKKAWRDDEGAQELWNICSKEKRKENEFFIRIGRHSGIENVTLDVPKMKSGLISNENIEGGKSRPKVLNNTYPLGFCLLSVKERSYEIDN